jgi:hypothetical protein
MMSKYTWVVWIALGAIVAYYIAMYFKRADDLDWLGIPSEAPH